MGEVIGEGPWQVGKAVLRVVAQSDPLIPSINCFTARPAGVDDPAKIRVQLRQFALGMKLAPWMPPSLGDKCGSHLTW
jgi:hypothetical protein